MDTNPDRLALIRGLIMSFSYKLKNNLFAKFVFFPTSLKIPAFFLVNFAIFEIYAISAFEKVSLTTSDSTL